MKNSTVIVIGVGAAALIGLYLWRKKNAAPVVTEVGPVVQEVKTDLSQIQMPVASDQKQIVLPGTLLEPTLPNTGIVPPSIAVASKPIPTVAPAPTTPVVQSQPTKLQTVVASNPSVKNAAVVVKGKTAPLALRGLSGNAFILN